jgi:hypothetical protein
VGVLSPRLVPHLTEKAARACQALIPGKQEVTAWKVPVRIAAVGQRANLTLPIGEGLPTIQRKLTFAKAIRLFWGLPKSR